MDIDSDHCYEDRAADQEAVNRLADDCCLPANEMLFEQIKAQDGRFRISFSISGVILELFQHYRPDVIRSFKKLAATGCVEFMSETYYHSLSSLHSQNEFERQISKHRETIGHLFGITPKVFRNTELIHNNRIASIVAGIGMKGILCEGVGRLLAGRSNNMVYSSPGENRLPVLLRNPVLSDDIAFRFGDVNWSEHPLTAEKFASWLHSHPADNQVINLFLDYETFGIHKKAETGIFEFLGLLPAAVLKNKAFHFLLPSEALAAYAPLGIYDVPQTISWDDCTNDNCVSCDNAMQNNTIKKIYSIGNLVMQSSFERDMDTWGRLQAADYFYHMASVTGNANRYSNPSVTPKEVFQNYTNQVADFEITLIRKAITGKRRTPPRSGFINLF